MKDKEL